MIYQYHPIPAQGNSKKILCLLCLWFRFWLLPPFLMLWVPFFSQHDHPWSQYAPSVAGLKAIVHQDWLWESSAYLGRRAHQGWFRKSSKGYTGLASHHGLHMSWCALMIIDVCLWDMFKAVESKWRVWLQEEAIGFWQWIKCPSKILRDLACQK